MLEDGSITVETYNSLIATLGGLLGGLPSVKDIDINLNIHGYDDFQRVSNAIGSTGGGVGGGSGWVGKGGSGKISEAAGGDVRPGQSGIVGEHGIEQFKMNYDGTATITPITNNYNNYNLGVTTTQSLDTVMTGFAILQAMQ
jgi:hypothetical protein